MKWKELFLDDVKMWTFRWHIFGEKLQKKKLLLWEKNLKNLIKTEESIKIGFNLILR